MKKEKAYLLGLDGGGTKTMVCVADEEGNILERFESGAFNMNGQSREKALQTLRDIYIRLKMLGYKINKCRGVGIGAAGISNPAVSQILKEAFKQEGFLCRIGLFGDHETALAAAFPECRGIVLISGTGSICIGRDAWGRQYRAGGYGHLIDDVGSAYAIARDMLSAVVRAEDGRAESTLLKKLVFEKLNIRKTEDLLGFLYQPGRSKKEVASLAPLISQAAAYGDRSAMEIERKSARDLADLVIAVSGNMPEEKHLALSGSVLLHNLHIRKLVCSCLETYDSSMEIIINYGEAAAGALRLFQLTDKACSEGER
ncbi:N-acetylglucosamine kinase [Novisyntrophococcus fermenticellae]|uniref:N-acetylglucosamine kinase n=1 Tax=Novisyntrophococcus fermenticellae TaxID=2068655 RepID=UPI001E393164|nr:BadF/BadG/BcrA/BcrD ATPase family protein [Novisyntrophococcus fermenticellae]